MRGVPRPAKEFAREGREGKIAGEPVTLGVESGASEESNPEHMYLAERATHPPLGLAERALAAASLLWAPRWHVYAAVSATARALADALETAGA